MSKDIRSYFFKPNGNKTKALEDKSSSGKKRVYNVDSDSDDEIFSSKPTAKKQKESKSPKKEQKSSEKKIEKSKKEGKPKEVIKAVNLESLFGKTPVQQKAQVIVKSTEKKNTETPKENKIVKEKKSRSKKETKNQENESKIVPSDEISFDNDDDFEATLLQLDENELEQKLPTPFKTPDKRVPKDQVSDKDQKSKEPQSSSKTEKSKFITPVKDDKEEIISKKQNKTPGTTEKAFTFDSEQKRRNAESYQRYINRSGPKNPGSKKIPKGNPTCLIGKAFVISGVLDSMEREEAAELIQKCGGRVTSAVSKKTNYIVIGEEAGASKLEKANKFGTTKLTEDELLDLIREKSGETIECDSSQDNFIEESPLKKEEKSKYFKPENLLKHKRQEVPEGCRKRLKIDPDSDTLNKNKSTEKLHVLCQDSSSSGIGSSVSDSQSSDSSKGLNSYGSPFKSERDLGESLWVDKYKPKSTKNIIGQSGDRSNVKKLTKWLQNWHKNHSQSSEKKVKPAPWAQNNDGAFFKASLLSGPPGVGKTTSVHLVCKELGLDIIEFNASDTRSKSLLRDEVAELLSNKSIRGFLKGNEQVSTKQVLVMDEVDGMAGNEDRGGIQELIQLIKNTRVPIVCMCNDRSHPKMRSLLNHCFDLNYSKPRLEQIKAAMMSVCFKEGIKIPTDALEGMISNSNHDIRQVLHNLSMWAVRDKNLNLEGTKIDSEKAKKPLSLGPWDVARRLFSKSEREKMSFRDKEDLFFQDYSLGPLFVQDTYIRVKPAKANNDKKKWLDCIARAAESISYGDTIERAIRSQNAWSLLPVQGIFSSVVPGFEMEGYVSSQIQFPVWLGKNSKRNRCDRLLQELQVHMRLSTTGSKQSVNLDYLSHLKNGIVQPLIKNGMDGVQQSLSVLFDYNLTREDLDSIVELSQWPGSKDLYSTVDSKVKAALTRAYNKEGKATPYATNIAIKKTTAAASSGNELGYAEDEDEVEEAETDNVEADTMIKAGKPKKAKPEKAKPEKAKPQKAKPEKGESSSKGKKQTKTSKKGKK